MEVFSITENLLGFYTGRDNCAANDAGARPAQKDWAQFDLDLGVCAYAFHHENRAIVFDTLVSPEHGRLLRAYLDGDAWFDGPAWDAAPAVPSGLPSVR